MLDALWKGHIFRFDREPEAATYGDAAGARLVMIAVGLEIVRLARNLLHLSSLPLGIEIAIYLVAALLLTRFVAKVTWDQIGFRRWSLWNTTEKAYFVEVLVLVNVVFLALFAARLRTVLSDPWSVFVPYLVFGFYQEVIYRGLLQTELVRRWGTTAGILASNTLFTFGPLHYQYLSTKPATALPMFAAIFAIGLLFAMVFQRSRNLWIVAVMHAFGNAYAVGALGGAR
jgi:membrane protease YdiL (CAAX protease family)